jgi:hypothetical protein
MGYIVLLLLSAGVTIYALLDCWRSRDEIVRGLPRPAWILLIILVGPLGIPPFGALGYLFFGRPLAPSALPQKRVVAPDDDPDFLRFLDLERRRAAAEERRRLQRERKEQERERKEQERERKELERQQRRDQRSGEPSGTASSGPASSGPAGPGTGGPGTTGPGPEAVDGDGRPTA